MVSAGPFDDGAVDLELAPTKEELDGDSLLESGAKISEVKLRDAEVVTAIVEMLVPSDTNPEVLRHFKQDMSLACSAMRGYVSCETVVTPAEHGQSKHTVIITFASYPDLRDWLESEDRQAILQNSPFKISPLDAPRIQSAHHMVEIDTLEFAARVPVSVPPPPKWKLALVTWIAVFSCVYGVADSGLPPLISKKVDGYVSVTTFCVLCCVVPPITYAVAPVLTRLFGPWLRLPRPGWSQTCEPMRTMYEGLHLFMPPPPAVDPKMVKKLQDQVQRLEGAVSRLRQQQCRNSNSHLDQEQDMVPEYPTDMHRLKEEVLQGGPQDLRRSLPVSCVAHHHVRWEHEDDFRAWCVEMREAMERYPGFLGLTSLHGKGDGLEYSQEYVNIFKFQTLRQLDAFVKSEDRMQLIRQLGPWLESKTEMTVAQDRHMLDAFTELFVSPGENARPRPPPVWKTTFLVIVGLMMCVWPVNEHLGPVLERCGFKLWSQTLVLTGINVVLNTYICVPFCIFLFGGWLNSPREPRGCLLIFLDRGLPNIGCQLFASLLYFGALITLVMTDTLYCLPVMEGLAAKLDRC